jgi:hypothetical protein
MNRWQVTPSHEWAGAWKGRLQNRCGNAAKTEVCGHLHRSPAEAERCARELVVRLNSAPMPLNFFVPDGMPADYYLG